MTSSMDGWITEFLSFSRIALVGATDKPEKWGHRIFKRLQQEGYEVLPVHPRLEEIEGVKCYPSLSQIEGEIDGVSIVVPPTATKGILEEARQKGVKVAWAQPGAESEEAIQYAKETDMSFIFRECVLVELDKRS